MGGLLASLSGNDVLRQDYVYFPWTTLNGQGRLQQIKSGVPGNATSLQDVSYGYDAVGNVLTMADAKAGGTQTQSFHYDALEWTPSSSPGAP